MFINKYRADWQTFLDALASKYVATAHTIYLLLDAVFSPGLHRRFNELSPSLLFDARPGCTAETRDVSPFLVRYAHTEAHYYTRRLAPCSGFPMMSVITTQESQTTLARRLAAWCVVEADQQRFNFRFPDTRRLPCIYAALTEQQKQQMTGPATEWSYIARDGTWEHLSLIPGITSIHNDVPKLTAQQFAALVADSEGDEIASMLHYLGVMTTEDPYLHHLIISAALKVSRSSSLNAQDKLDWCESCILERQLLSTQKIISKFSSWQKARLTNNEKE